MFDRETLTPRTNVRRKRRRESAKDRVTASRDDHHFCGSTVTIREMEKLLSH